MEVLSGIVIREEKLNEIFQSSWVPFCVLNIQNVRLLTNSHMKLKIKLNVSKNNNFESSFTRRCRHSTVETNKYNSLGLSPSRKEGLRVGIYLYLLTRFLPVYTGWEFTRGRFDSGAQCWSKVMTLRGGGDMADRV